MEPTVSYLLKQIGAGSYTAQDLKDFSSMAKGGSSLAPLHNFVKKLPADLLDKLKKRQDELLKGKFRVEINENAPSDSVVVTPAPAATQAATPAK
jgi:basic membrane protein A